MRGGRGRTEYRMGNTMELSRRSAGSFVGVRSRNVTSKGPRCSSSLSISAARCARFSFSRFFKKNIFRASTHTARRAGPDVAPLGGGQALPRAPRGARRGEGRATHRRALRVDTPRPPRQRAGRQETRLGDRGRDGLDAPRRFIRARRGRAATRGPRAAGAPAGGVQGPRGRPRSAEPVQRVRRERADQDRYRGFTARERRARAVGTRGGGGIREVPRALAAAEGDARRGGADPPPRGSRATARLLPPSGSQGRNHSAER